MRRVGYPSEVEGVICGGRKEGREEKGLKEDRG